MALNQSKARQPLIANNNITILSDHHQPVMHFSCVLDDITPLSRKSMVMAAVSPTCQCYRGYDAVSAAAHHL